MSLAILVAVAENGAIGRGNALPWHLPDDLKRFKALTLGHVVLMGRRTHESIGRLLPGRTNVVVATSGIETPGVIVTNSLQAALALPQVVADPLPFVIGGARLYTEALPQATHLYITKVPLTVEGDVFFPPIDWSQWAVQSDEPGPEGVRYVAALRRLS
jgi:dihydrofolate reductase